MHAVVTVEAHMPSLDRVVTYTALVPDAGEPPHPVLYQLHGASDDHRAWLYKSNLLRYLDGMPLLVVLPSGENSYYVDAHPRAMERFIVDDLRAHVERTYRVRPGHAAIGGLSMGGYGAIRLGLRHPRRYGSIYAHSSRLPSAAELPMFALERGLGDAEELDVDALAARVDRATMPALAFDCGTEDHLLADSRRFRDRLVALGLPHEYREHPGAHDWAYWDRHVPTALAHHRRALGF